MIAPPVIARVVTSVAIVSEVVETVAPAVNETSFVIAAAIDLLVVSDKVCKF